MSLQPMKNLKILVEEYVSLQMMAHSLFFFRYPQIRDYFNKEIKETEGRGPKLFNRFIHSFI